MLQLPAIQFPTGFIDAKNHLFRRKTFPGVEAKIPAASFSVLKSGDIVNLVHEGSDGKNTRLGTLIWSRAEDQNNLGFKITYRMWEHVGVLSNLGEIKLTWEINRNDLLGGAVTTVAKSDPWIADYWPYYAALEDDRPLPVFFAPDPDENGNFSDEGGTSVVVCDARAPFIELYLPTTKPMVHSVLDMTLNLWDGEEFDPPQWLTRQAFINGPGVTYFPFALDLMWFLSQVKQVMVSYSYVNGIRKVDTQQSSAKFILR